MCSSEKVDPGAGGVTYDSAQSLLAAVAPGMDLCTSDFTGWAVVEGAQPGGGGGPGSSSAASTLATAWCTCRRRR
jgi:hypothetical protein